MFRRHGRDALWATAIAALLASGCKGSDSDGAADAGSDRPPRICRLPKPLGGGPYFRDVTRQYNLHQDGLDVTGNRLATADIDGDGYPDLVVHTVTSNRRDKLDASPPRRYKRVLLNRPAPGGGRTFVDHTDASGFTQIRGGGKGRSAQFAVFADVDNDGDLDVFSGTYVDARSTANPDPGDRSEILLNDGSGRFTLARASDVHHKEKYSTTSASFVDYDRDGQIDLFVGYWYEIYGLLAANQDRLYRGDGKGGFRDVTSAMGLTTQRASGYDEGKQSRPTYGVTACDVDSDGDADLLVSAYGRQPNMLWRNDGEKFVDVGKASGFAADALEDYSDNEFYRCYCKTHSCSAPAPRVSCTTAGWNPGVDDKPWRLGGNTFTTVCGDVDNDGDMDLFNAEIAHWHIGKSSDPSQILLNTGGKPLKFERPGNDKLGLAQSHQANWNEGHISAALFDFDADGLLDLIVMDSDYPNTRTRLYHQRSDHTFEEIAKKAGIDHDFGQEVSIADLDRDGDLDVIMGTSTARGLAKRAQVHVYENRVGDLSNWLEVRLVGKGKGGANRSAVGARLTVKTDEGTQIRELAGGHGHFGLQHDMVLHVGLGSACDIDQIEVRWPDRKSTTTTIHDVRANYRVTIDQATGELTYESKDGGATSDGGSDS